MGILLAAVVFYIYFQLYLPKQTNKIYNLRSSIDQCESELDSLEFTSKLNTKMGSELDKLDIKYRSTLATFPVNPREPEIAYNLKGYANTNGVTLNSITLSGTQETGAAKSNGENKENKAAVATTYKLYTIPVNISATGEYLKMNTFLSTVENDKRLAKINNVSLAKADGAKVTATFSVDYYYIPGLIINLDYPFNKGSYGKEDMFR